MSTKAVILSGKVISFEEYISSALSFQLGRIPTEEELDFFMKHCMGAGNYEDGRD